jgi:hypothetical protein
MNIYIRFSYTNSNFPGLFDDFDLIVSNCDQYFKGDVYENLS